MEYSVYDLIRILLKKWHIILISMVVVAALAVSFSQKSYKNAVANYDEFTSETVPMTVETGTTVTKYTLFYYPAASTEDLLELLQDNSKADVIEPFLTSASKLSAYLFDSVEPQLEAMLNSEEFLNMFQMVLDSSDLKESSAINGGENIESPAKPLDVRKHLKVEYADLQLCLTIMGLEQTVVEQLLPIYKEQAEKFLSTPLLTFDLKQEHTSFIKDPPRLTATADLAKTVMQKPLTPPNLIRTAATAAMYAFVMTCFVILIVIFVKDSRRMTEKSSF